MFLLLLIILVSLLNYSTFLVFQLLLLSKNLIGLNLFYVERLCKPWSNHLRADRAVSLLQPEHILEASLVDAMLTVLQLKTLRFDFNLEFTEDAVSDWYSEVFFSRRVGLLKGQRQVLCKRENILSCLLA